MSGMSIPSDSTYIRYIMWALLSTMTDASGRKEAHSSLCDLRDRGYLRRCPTVQLHLLRLRLSFMIWSMKGAPRSANELKVGRNQWMNQRSAFFLLFEFLPSIMAIKRLRDNSSIPRQYSNILTTIMQSQQIDLMLYWDCNLFRGIDHLSPISMLFITKSFPRPMILRSSYKF